MRTHAFRGSHLPVLIKLVSSTHGPILELGCGVYSTHYLHWACYSTKRRFVSYENNPKYFDYINQFTTDYHEVNCVPAWDTIDLSEKWSIAFIDHCPDEERIREIKRLTHADFVVAHDSENKRQDKYQYHKIHGLFKYRWKYRDAVPHTSIFSNVYNLERFSV